MGAGPVTVLSVPQDLVSKLLHLHFKDDKTKGGAPAWGGKGSWGCSWLCRGLGGRGGVRGSIPWPGRWERALGDLPPSTLQSAGTRCCS